MIKEITMYSIGCDYPGCNADVLEGSDYSAYSDADGAAEYLDDADWREIDGKHYCHKHWVFPEDADEPRPMQ